ncbi:MAG: hypothetical protein O3A87_05970 [Verrucomicrobia bacterium]|nr:hypothetical protein [Verrucomicrobiota bacterium]MDA1006015.1 hypothetical protein [Verrucomicrobiota bacterium]
MKSSNKPSHPSTTTRPAAGKPLAAILATSLALSYSSSADLLVYEPYAYPDGALAGQGGALGTTGTWTTFDNNSRWDVHQEGNLSGVYLNNTNGPNLWDGTVDNLVTSGGYAGIPDPESVGQPAGYTGNVADHMDASIPLDPAVTATFTTGSTTWFSFVSVRGYNANPASPQVMLGTDPFSVDSRGQTTQTTGGGFGIAAGGGFPRFNNFDIFPHYYSGGIIHFSPGGYLGGTLGGHSGIPTNYRNNSNSDGVLDDATQTMPWVSGTIGADFGVPNIVVGKIEWDADTGGEDILTVVGFTEADGALDEAKFDALVAAKPQLSSANWVVTDAMLNPAPKPNLDQSAFDTLAVAGGKFWVDEIRVATTFEEVIGQTAPEPFKLWVAQDDPNLDFTWESQAGKLYRLRSSAVLDTEFATWDLVAEDLPNTAPLGSTSIMKPVDSTLFYRMEEYPAPPIAVYSENFDGVTAPAFPADWTTGAQGPDTGTTFWELGDPTGGVANGPAAPNSPSNCVGTNIATNHGFDTDIWLRTNAIDLTSYTEASLTFQQFKEIEDVGIDLDYGSIRILDASDNSELAVLEDQSVEGDTNGVWAAYTKALPAAAFTVPIKIEFRFEADDIDNFAGWYLDDLAITIPAP